MTRPPPISTLFPYTPLFRSCQPQGRVCGLRPATVRCLPSRKARVIEKPFRVRLEQHFVSACHNPVGLPAEGGAGRLLQPLRDRKSTRLNSSHLVISYAVFCL